MREATPTTGRSRELFSLTNENVHERYFSYYVHRGVKLNPFNAKENSAKATDKVKLYHIKKLLYSTEQ